MGLMSLSILRAALLMSRLVSGLREAAALPSGDARPTWVTQALTGADCGGQAARLQVISSTCHPALAGASGR